MSESFWDRPEGVYGRKLYNERFEEYRSNIQTVESCFKRYGVRRVQGPPGDDTRKMAVGQVVDMEEVMGSDRLPISDYFAVVPNYYGTYTPYKPDEEDFIVFSKTENRTVMNREGLETAGLMRYIIGLELVIRDFRNYEACREPLAEGNVRLLRHPCGSPLPPAEPNEKARVFDIPVGYISSFSYILRSHTVELTVVGQYRERIKMSIEVNLDPSEKPLTDKELRDLVVDDMSLPESE